MSCLRPWIQGRLLVKQSMSSKGTRGLLAFLYQAGSYRGLIVVVLKRIYFILLLYMFVLLAATSSMLWSTGPLHNSDLRDI